MQSAQKKLCGTATTVPQSLVSVRPGKPDGGSIHAMLPPVRISTEGGIANSTNRKGRLLLIRNDAVATKQLLMQYAQKSITQMGYVPGVNVTFFGL